MKNYRVWFCNSKCFASDEFLQQYESDLKEKELKADQFTGMLPTAFIAHAAREDADNAWNKNNPPEISSDGAENLLKIPTTSGVPNAQHLSTLVQQGVQKELEQQRHRAYEDEIQKMKENGGESPKGPADAELRARHGIPPRSTARFGEEESFSDRLAKLQDW